jgi:(p)ppGpp synthase/HD superfamily hydrolase
MIENEEWFRRARDEVRVRHTGKTDKLGAPYHEHFERVADRLLRLFPAATRPQVEAALLHDALEPGGTTEANLEAIGVTPEALRILRHITLPTDGRSYLQYIADLAATGDREAIEVKLADNLDATEYHSTRATTESRALMAETYDPSRLMLQDALIGTSQGELKVAV